MIASRRNARIDISFRGKVGGNLANISTDHNIVQNVDVNQRWIAKRGLTPMFKAYGITRELFVGPPQFGMKKYELPPLRFTQLDYDDFTGWPNLP
jgi:hypothetical protein